MTCLTGNCWKPWNPPQVLRSLTSGLNLGDVIVSFTLEGPRWQAQPITWAFATYQYASDLATAPFSHVMVPGVIAAEVAQAFSTWADVSGLALQQVTDSSAPSIRVGFGAFNPAITHQLGQTNYRYSGSSFAPDVVVRLEDPTETPYSVQGSDLVIGGYGATVLQLALHEVGHALGLGHSASASDIMYSVASASNRSLSASDIEGIHTLYPAAVSTSAVAMAAANPAPVPAAGTVALRGAHGDYVLAAVFGNQLYVQDTMAGRDGTRTLDGIQALSFTDGTAVFDPSGKAADVARLYRAAFGRAPDLAGLLVNTAPLTQGTVGINALAAAFVASPEFGALYGQTDTAGFVDALYRTVLHRAPDAAGAQSWATLTQATSRGAALQAMSDSPENRRQTLPIAGNIYDAEATRLYQAALNRAPDAPGLAATVDALQHGAAVDTVARGFVGSGEFDRAYGALGNDAFIGQLYQNVLHRTTDASGKADWTAQLDTGASRAHVLAGFAESNENRVATAGITHDAWVFVQA